MTDTVRVPREPTEAMLVNGREALLPLVRLDSYGPLIGLWRDMLAASPQGEKESDCVCVQRGDGPEGCGLCNETGVVTHPASPQGEGSSIGQNDQPGLAFSDAGEP